MSNWLNELKPGQTVIVGPKGAGDFATLDTVDRITPTQIITHHGMRFRRKNGREVSGDQWWWSSLEEPTPEAVARVRADLKRRRMLAYLRDVKWSELSSEVLERAVALVKAETPKESESK